ncbi:MAG: YdcF family protein [Pleurocapsa sp.]
MFFSSQPREELNVAGAIASPILSKSRLLFLLTLAIFIWLGYRQVQKSLTPPQAVLVLGGHEERERYAAKLGRQYRELPIWVSSGSPQDYAKKIFLKEGISGDRLHLDYRARDTVTNFTTLVDELKAQGINSVYLITSENHMTRAKIIGEIVFGSRGIVFQPISVPSKNPPEPIEKSLRDGVRSILWLVTGHTGVILVHSWQKTLYPN